MCRHCWTCSPPLATLLRALREERDGEALFAPLLAPLCFASVVVAHTQQQQQEQLGTDPHRLCQYTVLAAHTRAYMRKSKLSTRPCVQKNMAPSRSERALLVANPAERAGGRDRLACFGLVYCVCMPVLRSPPAMHPRLVWATHAVRLLLLLLCCAAAEAIRPNADGTLRVVSQSFPDAVQLRIESHVDVLLEDVTAGSVSITGVATAHNMSIVMRRCVFGAVELISTLESTRTFHMTNVTVTGSCRLPNLAALPGTGATLRLHQVRFVDPTDVVATGMPPAWAGHAVAPTPVAFEVAAVVGFDTVTITDCEFARLPAVDMPPAAVAAIFIGRVEHTQTLQILRNTFNVSTAEGPMATGTAPSSALEDSCGLAIHALRDVPVVRIADNNFSATDLRTDAPYRAAGVLLETVERVGELALVGGHAAAASLAKLGATAVAVSATDTVMVVVEGLTAFAKRTSGSIRAVGVSVNVRNATLVVANCSVTGVEAAAGITILPLDPAVVTVANCVVSVVCQAGCVAVAVRQPRSAMDAQVATTVKDNVIDIEAQVQIATGLRVVVSGYGSATVSNNTVRASTRWSNTPWGIELGGFTANPIVAAFIALRNNITVSGAGQLMGIIVDDTVHAASITLCGNRVRATVPSGSGQTASGLRISALAAPLRSVTVARNTISLDTGKHSAGIQLKHRCEGCHIAVRHNTISVTGGIDTRGIEVATDRVQQADFVVAHNVVRIVTEGHSCYGIRVEVSKATGSAPGAATDVSYNDVHLQQRRTFPFIARVFGISLGARNASVVCVGNRVALDAAAAPGVAIELVWQQQEAHLTDGSVVVARNVLAMYQRPVIAEGAPTAFFDIAALSELGAGATFAENALVGRLTPSGDGARADAVSPPATNATSDGPSIAVFRCNTAVAIDAATEALSSALLDSIDSTAAAFELALAVVAPSSLVLTASAFVATPAETVACGTCTADVDCDTTAHANVADGPRTNAASPLRSRCACSCAAGGSPAVRALAATTPRFTCDVDRRARDFAAVCEPLPDAGVPVPVLSQPPTTQTVARNIVPEKSRTATVAAAATTAAATAPPATTSAASASAAATTTDAVPTTPGPTTVAPPTTGPPRSATFLPAATATAAIDAGGRTRTATLGVAAGLRAAHRLGAVAGAAGTIAGRGPLPEGASTAVVATASTAALLGAGVGSLSPATATHVARLQAVARAAGCGAVDWELEAPLVEFPLQFQLDLGGAPDGQAAGAASLNGAVLCTTALIAATAVANVVSVRQRVAAALALLAAGPDDAMAAVVPAFTGRLVHLFGVLVAAWLVPSVAGGAVLGATRITASAAVAVHGTGAIAAAAVAAAVVWAVAVRLERVPKLDPAADGKTPGCEAVAVPVADTVVTLREVPAGAAPADARPLLCDAAVVHAARPLYDAARGFATRAVRGYCAIEVAASCLLSVLTTLPLESATACGTMLVASVAAAAALAAYLAIVRPYYSALEQGCAVALAVAQTGTLAAALLATLGVVATDTALSAAAWLVMLQALLLIAQPLVLAVHAAMQAARSSPAAAADAPAAAPLLDVPTAQQAMPVDAAAVPQASQVNPLAPQTS